MNSITDSQKLRRWFTAGVVLVVLWAIWLILRPLAVPISWAAVLAFLLFPLQLRLTRRLRNRPAIAAGLLTALTPVAIFIPLFLLGVAFADQISALTVALQRNPDIFELARWLDPQQHPQVAAAASWITSHTDVNLADAQSYLRQNLQSWASTLAKSSGQIFLNTAGIVLRFFLMLFILFFILRDGASWFSRLAKLLPLHDGQRDALFTRLGKVLRAVVYGCGLTALAQGTLVCIGFAIAGLSGPIVFGVLASVLALLPFGGAALVWVPGVLYLLGTGQLGWAVFLAVWGGLVSVSDNFIRPAVISRYTPVPTLLVFLGVIGGVSAFGLIGFIVGPVILVLATELLRYAEGSLTRRD
jgi:predicted PurR-regulated permease PerM